MTIFSFHKIALKITNKSISKNSMKMNEKSVAHYLCFSKKAVEEEEENVSVFLQNPKDFIDLFL